MTIIDKGVVKVTFLNSLTLQGDNGKGGFKNKFFRISVEYKDGSKCIHDLPFRQTMEDEECEYAIELTEQGCIGISKQD